MYNRGSSVSFTHKVDVRLTEMVLLHILYLNFSSAGGVAEALGGMPLERELVGAGHGGVTLHECRNVGTPTTLKHRIHGHGGNMRNARKSRNQCNAR